MGKRIIFKEICNFRDLGDYNKIQGGLTHSGKIYRSSMLFGPNEIDSNLLKDLNMQSIIDLRSPTEQERLPNPYKNTVHHYLPINLSGNKDKGRAFELSKKTSNPYFMSDRYLEYLESGTQAIADLFRFLLDDSHYPLVFHCSAGKDRTGVIAYLILMLNGVHVPEIIADYQISYTYIKDDSRILKDQHFMNVYKSHPEILEQFHQAFIEKHQSVNQYFISLNFTPDEIKRLKSLL